MFCKEKKKITKNHKRKLSVYEVIIVLNFSKDFFLLLCEGKKKIQKKTFPLEVFVENMKENNKKKERKRRKKCTKLLMYLLATSWDS